MGFLGVVQTKGIRVFLPYSEGELAEAAYPIRREGHYYVLAHPAEANRKVPRKGV